jgi:PAS domain-containing protein
MSRRAYIWGLQQVFGKEGASMRTPMGLDVQDSSEEPDTAAELEHSRQRYTELVDSVEGIVWELDPSTFRFVFISKAAERLLGYPTERWLNEPGFWQQHLHPKDRRSLPSPCGCG